MSKIFSHLPALCNIVRRIAIEAGDITLEHFEEGMACSADIKADGSPVTKADHAAEEHIIRALRDLSADIPIIAEESAASGDAATYDGEGFGWFVDPLDGTRAFAAGDADYTVNIALVKDGVPHLGVIYAPAHGELYAAHDGAPAIRWKADTEGEKEIRARRPVKAGLTIMASKNRNQVEFDTFLEEHKVEKIIRRASSLKICAVASGKADLYPGFGPTCLWDTAAGHAILRAAGGDIVNFEGRALTYIAKKGGDFYNPPFIARSDYLA
jgi:3'(2'), 5'-bisphosphate nucleotidase